MDSPVTKQLVFDHFAGRVTALQRRMIEEWLQQPDHIECYYEWLEEWENQNPQYAIDVESALDESLRQLEAEQMPMRDKLAIRLPAPFAFTWRWAAVIAGFLLVGSLLAGRSYILYRSVKTSYGEIRKIVLSEGSVVTLNANSSLRYARFGFGQQTRQVWLTGEANFDVKHLNTQKQFVVSTDQKFDVIVWGTEFSVFSRPRGANVVLRRGKIEFVQTGQPKERRLTLKPGDLVTIDSSGLLSTRHRVRPEMYTAWQEHRFEFEETTLSEIAKILEENYGVQVSIVDPTLAQRTVSGTFSTRTATELSQVIAELLEIHAAQQNNTITFANMATPYPAK